MTRTRTGAPIMLRCAILDDYRRVALSCADWQSLGGNVTVDVLHEPAPDRDALAQRLALPADHPLRMLSNVVPTPHLGYVTREQYCVFYGDAVEDIRAWLKGAPVRTLSAVGH